MCLLSCNLHSIKKRRKPDFKAIYGFFIVKDGNIVLIICQQILKNEHRVNTSITSITMENKDILLYNNILIVALNRDKI